MSRITIRNLSDEVHYALRRRASERGNSLETEVCKILESAALPEGRFKLGSYLAAIGQGLALSDEEIALFDDVIDRSPARVAYLE